MRLGQYLVWVERHAGWTLDDMEYLEDQFQEEPWMNWVQVVSAENLQNDVKPFVLLANSGTKWQQLHTNNMSRDEEEVCTLTLRDSSPTFVYA